MCKAFWKRSITETSAPAKNRPPPGSDTEKDQAAYYDYALQLEQALSGDEKALFEAFADANQELCEHSCCEYFSDGFRLGAQIMLEVTQGGIIPPLPHAECVRDVHPYEKTGR